MPTTAGTTPALPSTSTGIAPKKAPVQRIPVRLKKAVTETLLAYQLPDPKNVILPSGHELRGYAGDWVVTRNEQPIDLLSQARFEQTYEPIPEPTLVLTKADQTALEQQLGFGATASSQTLRQAVQRLAALQIGSVDVNFSVTQWEELARRAERRGKTVSEYMQQVVDRLLQDLWTNA